MPFTEFAFERAAVSGLAVGQVIADWHREQPRLVIGYDHRVSKLRPIGLSFQKPHLPHGQTRLAGPNLQDQRDVQYKKLVTGLFTL
jgi:hypothetical protein